MHIQVGYFLRIIVKRYRHERSAVHYHLLVCQQQLRQALTRLRPLQDAADKAVTQGWGNNIRHGAVNASDADYEPVRALRRRARIPENGNF